MYTFPEYECTIHHAEYGNFKKGNIKCPYERRVYGVGYIGEGKYKVKENGKTTKCYETWHSMLRRCYDEKYQEKNLHIKIAMFKKNFITFKILVNGLKKIITRYTVKKYL